VSVLNRLRLNSHLDDTALAAIWADSASSSAPSHPHLQACPACRARFGNLTTWMHEIRADAVAEADDVFTPERLAAQHAQILRRLEAAERPARVIAFPRFSQPLATASSGASRWIAAAAAAGLIVGVGVGQMMDLRPSMRPGGVRTSDVRPVDTPGAGRAEDGVQTVSTTGRDEAFLSELDASLSRSAVPELRALDEFTPHAGERPR
jgi:hypothetical protein